MCCKTYNLAKQKNEREQTKSSKNRAQNGQHNE